SSADSHLSLRAGLSPADFDRNQLSTQTDSYLVGDLARTALLPSGCHCGSADALWSTSPNPERHHPGEAASAHLRHAWHPLRGHGPHQNLAAQPRIVTKNRPRSLSPQYFTAQSVEVGLTSFGLRVALFFSRTYARLLRPGLASLAPSPPSGKSRLRQAFEKLEGEIYRFCEGEKLVA